ncbi:ATP-binding protein [Devosia sp. MC532]|uniref:AlbA family DNA-binding domain-containing protein n=1 Tax=Devosia sp. MC532 TaxID=2799788 RepID=UPI0018F5A9FC|nr:ATP-binding protein [Devosia sp. MC532]MBJ7576953.1 ATP-binding protein [Devosia sp. MC532]
MRTRSISDKEIAIIKAMIRRSMANKDIQFFFNRPDRSVNSGRISGIRNGSYSNSGEIAAATDEELEAFLRAFEPDGVSASISVPQASEAGLVSDPVSAATLRGMFYEANGIWFFRHGESDRHECKEGFGFRHCDKWLRAVAALANNRGGYLIFGLKEQVGTEGRKSSFDVVGLTDDFENADPVEFTKRLKATFDPTPVVDIVSIEIGEKKIGVLHVHQHPARPVIAVRNEGNLVKEGEIYFRYQGQSSRIKYSDLRAIFDERDRQARANIMPMIEQLLRLGPHNAMIADLANGTLADGTRSFSIGKELIDQIKFIREGQFTEKEGSPALRLVGDLQAVDSEGQIIRRGFVTPTDLLNDFLEQQTPYEPKEYIRCAVEGGNGGWLPLHYFANRCGLNRDGLVAYIKVTAAPQARKDLYAARASGVQSAYSPAVGQSVDIITALHSGNVPEITDIRIAAHFGRAVAGLKQKPGAGLSAMLKALKISLDMVQASQRASWLSPVRRGISRLDELYFGGGDWTQP